MPSYTLNRFLVRYFPPTIILEYKNASENPKVSQEDCIFRSIQISDPLICSASTMKNNSETLNKMAESVLDKIPSMSIHHQHSSTKNEDSSKKIISSSSTEKTTFHLSPSEREELKPQILEVIQILISKCSSTNLVETSSTSSPHYTLTKIINHHVTVRTPITSATFNKQGDRILIGAYDRLGKIFDTHTGQLLTQLQGHRNVVYTVAFNNPFGNRCATGSFDRTARIWDTETGLCFHSLQGHTQEIVDVAFNCDSTLLGTAGMDTTARIFDVESGQELHACLGHDKEVVSVSFDPFFGDLFLTASFDGTAKIYDTRSGKNVFTLFGHTGELTIARFNPVLQFIVATAGIDRRVGIWDLRKAEQAKGALAKEAAKVRSAAAVKTGKSTVEFGDAHYQVVNGHVTPFSSSNPVPCLRFQNLLTSNQNNSTTSTRSLSSSLPLHFSFNPLFARTQMPSVVSYSSSTTSLASFASTLSSSKIHHQKTVHTPISKIMNGFSVRVPNFGDEVLCLDFHPITGNQAAASTADGVVRVFDVGTGRTIAEGRHLHQNGTGAEISQVKYTPKGNRILAVSADNTMCVWETPSASGFSASPLKLLQSLRGHTDEVFGCGSNYDGSLILSASKDNTVRVYKQ